MMLEVLTWDTVGVSVTSPGIEAARSSPRDWVVRKAGLLNFVALDTRKLWVVLHSFFEQMRLNCR